VQILHHPGTVPVFPALRGSIPDFWHSGNAKRLYFFTFRRQGCLQNLDVTLMGDCIRYFPAILKAIHSGKQTGLGPSRIAYNIASVGRILPGETIEPVPVDPDDWIGMNTAFSLSDWLAAAPGVSGSTAFKLATPVRLRKQGKYMGDMEWPYFFAAIARRLESLNCLFFRR